MTIKQKKSHPTFLASEANRKQAVLDKLVLNLDTGGTEFPVSHQIIWYTPFMITKKCDSVRKSVAKVCQAGKLRDEPVSGQNTVVTLNQQRNDAGAKNLSQK